MSGGGHVRSLYWRLGENMGSFPRNSQGKAFDVFYQVIDTERLE